MDGCGNHISLGNSKNCAQLADDYPHNVATKPLQEAKVSVKSGIARTFVLVIFTVNRSVSILQSMVVFVILFININLLITVSN